MSGDKVAGSAWAILQPITDYSGQRVKGMRIDRVTQSYPSSLKHNERAFYLGVTVPKSVFGPLPNVNIDVPEAAVVTPEVTLG